MNKLKNLIILIVIIIINYAQMIQTDDEIIELNCVNQTQCKQFEHSGIKSSCLESQCRCTLSEASVNCHPSNSKMTNIIGGPCPCKIPDAECDKEQSICYCVSKFMPSRCKRRCIPKKVALNGKCEETSQCQKADVNAICQPSTKECTCMEHFVSEGGHCLSILGNKSSNPLDTQGINEYLPNARYSDENQQFFCDHGYFASNDSSKCLKESKYGENCTEHLQCTATMGVGGICVDNVCQCSENYFTEEKKTHKGVNKTVCTRFLVLGDYCRYDGDCYQHQLNSSDQSMLCIYGECNCKQGFKSFSDGPCFKVTSGGNKSSFNLLYFFFLCTGVLFCI